MAVVSPVVARRVAPGRTQHRMRLLAVCVLLTALSFQQQPGRIAPDTKLDLVVDPVRFLGRALHLWEPLGFFGQVQNQAYGYLFPMGPFFALGRLAQLPPWVVQRLWVSALLCAAFLGVVRLARLLGVGSPATRLVAGLAYALAPRMVTVLGAASIEALPMATAPWVLVPLVGAAALRSPRRAAAWSGVAILCTGGVNAAATLAVLPLPALWLLTRAPGSGRNRLIAWWAVAVPLATAWWVVPLLLLGRYSPPFLDFIESARVTTLPTNLTEVLRGTSHWLGFLAEPDGPVWRAGWLLVTTPTLIVDTVLVAAAGLLGLAMRGLPERTWAVLGLLTGVVLVTFGHVGPLDGLLAGPQRHLLDGALAPFRNVHKYDPVLRLPLALGLAHLLGVVLTSIRGRPGGVTRVAVYAAVAAVLAGMAAPLLVDRLVPRGSFAAVPDYWRETAAFLAASPAHDRALLVPGARFGQYYWGDPRDEPLQPLARSPWAVRDAVPLAPAGNIRMLDALERRLATGQPSAGLSSYVARAGVRYLVVRNDLDYARAGAPRPVLVHQAIEQSPGFRRVASFGPVVGGGAGRSDLVVDQLLDRPYAAVEVYEVSPSPGPVEAYPLSQVTAVSGGPESLLALTDRRWLGGRPAVLSGDLPPGLAVGQLVVTDGMRRREVTFGRIEDDASAVLTPADPRRLGGTARDYLPWAGGRHETVARLTGAETIAASSSASDPDAFGGARPEHQPFAAVDGDERTAWLSSGIGGAAGQWLELRLSEPTWFTTIRLALDADAPGARVTRVRVTTDRGSVVVEAAPDGRPQQVAVPPGPSTRVRVSAERVEGTGAGFTFGVRELAVPGLSLGRPLVTPLDVPTGGSPPLVALAADDLRRPGCVRVGGRPLCATALARPGEEERGIDRVVRLRDGGAYDVVATARPRPGAALQRRLAKGSSGTTAMASSSAVDDPAGSPQAAVDRNLDTGWVARPGDTDPALVLRLPGRRRITGLQVLVDEALAASSPTRVRVTAAGERSRVGRLDRTGTVRFAPLTTDRVEIRFLGVHARSSYDPYARVTEFLPVGVSELRLLGADDLRRPPASHDASLPCGQGPPLTVGGVRVPTRVSVTTTELRRLAPVTVRPCLGHRLTLTSGETRVTAPSTPEWSLVDVSLLPAGAGRIVPAPVPVDVRQWEQSTRGMVLPAGAEPTLLVVHENRNDGWTATAGGRPLQPVTVDGWQQGWVVPAGDATRVRLQFGPDRSYRLGLAAGAVLAAGLLALAVGPVRRLASLTVVRGRSMALPTRAVLAVLALLLAAGPVGALVAAAGLVVALPARSARRVALPALAVLGMTTAGLLVAHQPWDSGVAYAGNGSWAQAAAVTALAAVAATWAADGQRPTRSLSRRARRSRSR
jgi:arabinofuranan 3-O-arabinosyltransferase